MNPYQYYSSHPPAAAPQQPQATYYSHPSSPAPLPVSYLPAASSALPAAYSASVAPPSYTAVSRDAPPVVRYFHQPFSSSARSPSPPQALPLPASYPPPLNPASAAPPPLPPSVPTAALQTQTAQGLQHLLDAHCPQQTPESISQFLLTNASVSAVAAADWLTQPTRFHQQTLSIVLGQQDYGGLSIDQALLLLLATLDPRSDAATERVLAAFAGYYYSQNAGAWVGGDEAVLAVATALMAVWRGLIDRDTFVNDALSMQEPALTRQRLVQMYDTLTAQRTGMREEGRVEQPAAWLRQPVAPLNLSATPLSFLLVPPAPLPLQQPSSSYAPLQPPAPLSHMKPTPFASHQQPQHQRQQQYQSAPPGYSNQHVSAVPSPPYQPSSAAWSAAQLQQQQPSPAYVQYEPYEPPSRPMTPITLPAQHVSYNQLPDTSRPPAHSPALTSKSTSTAYSGAVSATAAYSVAAGLPQPNRAPTPTLPASAVYAASFQRQQQQPAKQPPPPVVPTPSRTTPVTSRNDKMLAQPLLHQPFQPPNPAPAYPLTYAPPPSYQATFPSAPPPPSRAVSVSPLSAVPSTRASSLYAPYPPPITTRAATTSSAASFTPSNAPFNPASAASLSPLRAPSFDFQRLSSLPPPLLLSSPHPPANPAYTAASTTVSSSSVTASPIAAVAVKMSRTERKAAEAVEKERKKEAERKEKEVELEGLLAREMHILQQVMEWRESGQDEQNEEKVREPTLSTLLFPSRQEKGVREEWMAQLKELERKRQRLTTELRVDIVKAVKEKRKGAPRLSWSSLTGDALTMASVETFEYLLSLMMDRIDDYRSMQGVLQMLLDHCTQMQQRKEANEDDLTPLYAAVTSPRAMHALLLVLLLYAKDETIIELMTRLLVSYATIDVVLLNALLDNDMLSCLLAALDHHLHRPVILERALRFFLSLSSQLSHQRMMMYHHVHTFCLDLLSQPDITVIDATGSITALCLQLLTSFVSVSEENRDKLVQANALSAVIERIGRPNTPLELVMDGLQCLDTMTVSFTLYLVALSSDRLVHALLSLCTANPTALAVQRQCVSILLRLCDHDDENKQRICLSPEGDVGLLLTCINNHGEHEDITMTCCILLSRLLAFRQSNARLLGNVRVQDVQDGIHAIMPILHKHLYSPSLQLHATSALYHFLSSLPLYRLTLADGVADGLVDVLARALHMYVNDIQYVRQCCACLLQLIIFFPSVGEKLREMKVAQELDAVRQRMKQRAGGQQLDRDGEECMTVMNTLINVIKTNAQSQSQAQAQSQSAAQQQPVDNSQRLEGEAEVVGQEGRERRRSRRKATPPASVGPISLASRAISAPHRDVDLVAQYWEPLAPERRSSLPPVHALNLTLTAEQQVILVPPASLEPPLSSPHQALVSASSSFLRPDFRPSVYLTLPPPVAVSVDESKAVSVAAGSQRTSSPVLLRGAALLDVLRGFRAAPPPSSQLSVSLSLASLLQRWCDENDGVVLGWAGGEPADDVDVLALSLLGRLGGRQGSERVRQFQQRFAVGDVTRLSDDEVSRLLDALLSAAALPAVQEEGKAEVEAAAVSQRDSMQVEGGVAKEGKEREDRPEKKGKKEKVAVLVEVAAHTKHTKKKKEKRDEQAIEEDPRLSEARQLIVSAIQSLKTSTPVPWQLQSLHALLSLTSSASPTALPAATLIDMMMAQRTSATIIRSMRRLESNSDIQRLGCALLCFLASSPPSTSVSSSSPASYRLRLSDEGAVECAVNALQLDSDTAQQALALLSSLLSATSIAAQVKRTSVVSVVYIVMRRFARDVRVQRWGVQCARRIADVDRSDSSMVEPVALSAITNALTVGLEAADGQAELLVDACDVLAWMSLCRRDSEVSSHDVELVCQLLERSEEAVRRKGCDVLKRMWELAKRKKPLKERMEAVRAMERVAECESKEEERVLRREEALRQERLSLERQAEEQRLKHQQAEEEESRKQRLEQEEQLRMEEAAAKAKREMQQQRQHQPLLVTREEEEEDEVEEEQSELDEEEDGATTEEEDNPETDALEAEDEQQQQQEQPLLQQSQLDSEAIDSIPVADELSPAPTEAEDNLAELNDSVHSYEVVEATTPTAESLAALRATQHPPIATTSVLSAIRGCIMAGGSARIDGDKVAVSSGVSLPRKSCTAWRYRKEYLTLDSIVFFLDNEHLKLSEYVKACNAAGVQVVPFGDRAALLDYLQGETESSEHIDAEEEARQQQSTTEPVIEPVPTDEQASPPQDEDSKQPTELPAVALPMEEVVAVKEEKAGEDVSAPAVAAAVVAVTQSSDDKQQRKQQQPRQHEHGKKNRRGKKGKGAAVVAV